MSNRVLIVPANRHYSVVGWCYIVVFGVVRCEIEVSRGTKDVNKQQPLIATTNTPK
jgi:hypothetical protein